MITSYLFKQITYIRIVEWRYSCPYQFSLCIFYLFFCWIRYACIFLSLFQDNIFIKCIQQVFRDCSRRCTNLRFQQFTLCRRHSTVQTNNTIGKRSQCVFVLCPQRYIHHQFSHTNSWLPLQCSGIRLFGFCNAHCIHNYKMVFIFCSRWGNFLQIFFTKYTGAPAFHLLKVILATYITHKNQTLNSLYISPRCNHIHSNSNTGIIIISKRT